MSTSEPAFSETFRKTIRRSIAAWNEFFFKPRLPYTLGLMRICAGIFILYVHGMGHTFDLYSLFGPDGWADARMTDELRKDLPFNPPPSDWSETYNVAPPLDKQTRQAVLMNWMQHLPTDPDRRRQALEFLDKIPLFDFHADNQALAFAEFMAVRPKEEKPTRRLTTNDYRPATTEERKEMLDALKRKELLPTDLEKVPQYLHKESVEEREAFGRRALEFVSTLPPNPGDVTLIMLHLQAQSQTAVRAFSAGDPRTELQRTLLFLTGKADPSGRDTHGPYLPNDLTQRQEVLDYINRWTLDPRLTYGKGRYIWSIWFHVTERDTMALVHFLFLVAMTMFAAGLFTRVTSVITWIGMLSYVHRCDQMVFGMDTMMNIACIYLMIGPSGATLSLDRWLEKRRAQRNLDKARAEKRDTSEYEAILAGPRPSALAGFVMRLVQIHFCFIYAASGCSKLKGPAWWSHSAIWMTIVNPEFSPTVFQPYMWLMLQLSQQRWLAEIVMSIGAVSTLFLEIGFPFLVWRPVLRPYMIMAATLLHTGIAVLMGLTVFGLFMLVLLMAFIPPETVLRWLELSDRKVRGPVTADAAAPKPVAARA